MAGHNVVENGVLTIRQKNLRELNGRSYEIKGYSFITRGMSSTFVTLSTCYGLGWGSAPDYKFAINVAILKVPDCTALVIYNTIVKSTHNGQVKYPSHSCSSI